MPDVENFRLIHIYHVKTSQIFPKCGENFRNLHIYCVEKSEISPHDRFFFSTNIICDICDKYEVCTFWVAAEPAMLQFQLLLNFLLTHAMKFSFTDACYEV